LPAQGQVVSMKIGSQPKDRLSVRGQVASTRTLVSMRIGDQHEDRWQT
jgi:hypothetical protein